jgi:hypothetical protein
MILRAVLMSALVLIAAPVAAETINTPSCRQDLAATWSKMEEMLGRLKSAARAGQDEKCATYRHHAEVVARAREVFERCKTGRDRIGDIAHMDGALDDVNTVIDRECSPPAGIGVARPHVRVPDANTGETSWR